jgi:hypothetical protein
MMPSVRTAGRARGAGHRCRDQPEVPVDTFESGIRPTGSSAARSIASGTVWRTVRLLNARTGAEVRRVPAPAIAN